MNQKKEIRLLGLCFISVMLCYGIGSALLENENPVGKRVGIALVVLNSLIVCYLGCMLPRELRFAGAAQTRFYFASRLIEAVLLLIALYFRIVEPNSENSIVIQFWCYQTAMFSLGIGSVVFGISLQQSHVLSNGLLTWGIYGYSLLATGCIAEALGFPIGIYLSIPGGLFELTLGFLLLFNGSFARSRA